MPYIPKTYSKNLESNIKWNTHSTHDDIYKFIPRDQIRTVPQNIRDTSENNIAEAEFAKYLQNFTHWRQTNYKFLLIWKK